MNYGETFAYWYLRFNGFFPPNLPDQLIFATQLTYFGNAYILWLRVLYHYKSGIYAIL
jgi:hypothetical protein